MPRVSDASSFTANRRLNAQSITTTGKPTQSSVPSVARVSTGVIGTVVKASAIAASVSPATSIVATATTKKSTQKRG